MRAGSDADAAIYKHTHVGRVIIWITLPLIVFCVWFGIAMWTELGQVGQILFWIIPVSALLALGLFCTLTTRVDGHAVTIWFGPGFPRKRIPLEQIEAAEAVERSWLWGYGLRWTPRGWLWRASGVQAVEVYRTGQKSVFIGTDDPDGLVAAIEHALAG